MKTKAKKLLALLGLPLFACSTFSTEFVDADGTTFKSRTMIAPFSKMDQDVAKMGYKWTPENGEISIGRDITGVDQTAQIEAARVAMDAVIKAAQAYLAATTGIPPVSIPSLPLPESFEIPEPPPAPEE